MLIGLPLGYTWASDRDYLRSLILRTYNQAAQLFRIEELTVAPVSAAGNILNLLHLDIDVRDYDFVGLCVWQADLRPAGAHNGQAI